MTSLTPPLRTRPLPLHAATGIGSKDDWLKMSLVTPTVKDFINYPGLKSCMVKQLTGSKCATNVPVDEARLAQAVDVVRRAAFVGITDEWNDSLCLFHAMHGGELNEHLFQNVRDTGSIRRGYSPDDAPAMLTPEDDPYDWQLYLVAKAIFRQRQKQYGLPTYEPPADEA